jgi:hypothetical protein
VGVCVSVCVCVCECVYVDMSVCGVCVWVGGYACKCNVKCVHLKSCLDEACMSVTSHSTPGVTCRQHT